MQVRHEAARALGQMDEAGFPYLLKGMHSGSAEVRRASLEAVYKPVLVKHERETFELLIQFASDRDPALRQTAIMRLAWFEKRGRGALPALQYVALNDSDPAVRLAAAEAAFQIGIATSGRKLSHEEVDDLKVPRGR